MKILGWTVGLALALAVARCGAAEDPPKPKDKEKLPEVAEVVGAILVRGADLGPDTGWFHPGQGRFDWKWLAQRRDADGDGAIFADEFRGPRDLFARLDRDADGAITPEDFDWTAKSGWLRMTTFGGREFQRADANSNGKLSKEEWVAFFNRMAKEKGFVTPDDLRRAVPTAPPRERPGARPMADPDEPSRWTLLKGVYKGEVGLASEGPKVGDRAPGFALKTVDGTRTVALADVQKAKKPVVLIFGSFT
ncbi:MAG TPA: hypothetical protein VG406_26935 [Isosphaeraceae bacterium]|jgi:hypothetical protein|nr:hypothetical protein [Isosphaeraceae bacterium]